jgi:hypothetical protein
MLHVHWRLHSLVNPISEVGGGDDKHQFRDLLHVEMLAQRVEISLVDAGGPGREFFSKLDRSAFFLAKDAAIRAARLLQRLDLLVRDALPLPRSGVSAASILTPIHQRGAKVREFLDFRRQRARRPDLGVKLDVGTEHVGLVGDHFEEVDDAP